MNIKYMGKFLVKCQNFPICFVIVSERTSASKERAVRMPLCVDVRNQAAAFFPSLKNILGLKLNF